LIQDLDIALLRTFVAIVDTGGLTSAGKKVGRTQPAITHQIKRLEDGVGRTLFGVNRRQLSLTRDGEVLLEFARAILRLNDEARGRFAAPEISGHVTLGIPDLYASYILPEVLENFSRAYPNVEIELRCTRSVHLHAAVESNEIDIALMTNQPGFRRGQLVRREPLVWVAGVGSSPELRKPLPLAVLPQGSLYRHLALEALGAAGQQWSIRSVCDSIAGLQAAVFAGLAVSVFPRCAIVSNVRCLDESEGMPKLPTVDLVMHRKSQGISNAAEQLAQYIARELSDSVSAPIARESDSR
jgi:DNA-binding transcriptional LysR family regulator